MERHDEALKAIRAAILANGKTKSGRANDPGGLIEAAAPFFPELLKKQCRVLCIDREHVLLGRNEQGARCFYRLLKGDISVQREVMNETVTLQRVASGDWLLEPHPCHLSEQTFAIAECDSMVLEVPAQEFLERLELEQGFSLSWCAELGSQIARMQRRLERISLRQATQRIVHYLLTESNGGCGEVELPFNKCTWAAQLGMAAETLSRALTDLQDAGWLERIGRGRFRLLRSN